jgi:hypothetical protein
MAVERQAQPDLPQPLNHAEMRSRRAAGGNLPWDALETRPTEDFLPPLAKKASIVSGFRSNFAKEYGECAPLIHSFLVRWPDYRRSFCPLSPRLCGGRGLG